MNQKYEKRRVTFQPDHENVSRQAATLRQSKEQTEDSSLKMLNELFKVNKGSWYGVQFSLVAQSCPTLCDPVNRSMPGLPVQDRSAA